MAGQIATWWIIAATFVLVALPVITLPNNLAAAGDPIIGRHHGVIPIQSMGLRGLGLSATVQVGQLYGPGYYPVRLTITSMGPVPADKRLTFRLATHPGGEHPPSNGLLIEVPIVIPQGSKTTTATRYLPKWSLGQFVDVSIFDNGQLIPESSITIGDPKATQPLQFRASNWGTVTPVNLLSAGYSEAFENWLYIDSSDEVSLEMVPNVQQIYHGTDSGLPFSNESIQIGFPDDSDYAGLAAGQSELPTDWRGYQTHDVVFMNSTAQNRLATNQAANQAIREWILQGGVAVVYDAPNLLSVLDVWQFRFAPDPLVTNTLRSLAVNRDRSSVLLKEAAENMVTILKQGDAVGVQERYEHAQHVSKWSVGMLPDLSDPATSLPYFQSLVERATSAIREDSKQIIDHIHVQPVGAGLVLSIDSDANIDSDGQFLPTRLHWSFVKRLVNDRSSIALRQGTEPVLGNMRFRQWTIPGVLQPPVYSFMGFLTVFVVLVGPVAYRQTTKHGRSHLMFAIAPVLALATTAAMLGYGLVADGFGTRVRVRQLTWVDGASGDAGTRVRATYFAGIRPRNGLRFPGHASVMRQAETTGRSWQQEMSLPPGLLGSITIRPDGQVFDASFLPSRDQRQFIVHAPRRDIGSVRLIENLTEPIAKDLSSTFDFPFTRMVCCDQQGQYWWADEIAPQSKARCVPIKDKEASKRLARLYNDFRPVAEIGGGFGDEELRRIFDPLESLARILDLEPSYTVGTFEDWLRLHLQMTGELPPGYFVAIAPVSDEAVAVDGSQMVDSVHYVFGTLE